MKNLLYKELKLVISPVTYMFCILSGLLLIPSYPYCVGMLYCILALNITLNMARANNDHMFTAMLPVPRNHIVMAKHITVVFIQLLQVISAIPFALISSLVINKSGNIVGMDANFAFFGLTLIEFSVFNIIFLPWYFKTGYKAGMPMLIGSLVYGVSIAFFEILIAVIPVLNNNLDSLNASTFIYQIPVLIAGIIIYFAVIYLSYRLSVKKFEKVSL